MRRKYTSLVIVLTALLSMIGLSGQLVTAAAAGPVSIILDTDIEEDVDDVGTVAMLHALQTRGEARVLAMMVNTSGEWGAPALDALNTFYDRPSLPIGTLKPTTTGTRSVFNQTLAAQYPNDLRTGFNAPDAVVLYRQVLAREPDASVTIASVGLLTNLRNLLASPADSISPLNGRDLVARKVLQLVVMGGAYPSGSEFNFNVDPAATAAVINNWPTRAVFSGFEVGNTVLTGSRLRYETAHTSPVRRAYTLYSGEGGNRSSWDQTAAYYAVRGTAGLFAQTGAGGRNVVDGSNGSNQWVSSPGANQVYLTKTAPDSAIATAIENLMVEPPPPIPSSDFVLGVNLNGPAVTIDGNPWRSQTTASASGLTFSTPANAADNTTPPSPAASGDLATMLRSEYWRSGEFTISQALANGPYRLYFWVLEDYRDGYHNFDVRLEGQPASTVRSGRLGEWARHGPFDASVADGTLSIQLLPISGDVVIQGLAIYRGAGSDQPTVSFVNRQNGQAIDVPNGTSTPATQLMQWPSEASNTNQDWRITDVNGIKTIISARTGQAIDLYAWGMSPGAAIVQYPPTGNTNQQWRFIDAGGGYVKIVSTVSGLLVAPVGGSGNNGTLLEQQTDSGSYSQHWLII